MTRITLFALTALLCGCEMPLGNGKAESTSQTEFTEREISEMRGKKFARNRCSDCHAVEAMQTSPTTSAPPFETIVNTPDLTQGTLTQWLNKSHDYPREMYFEIPEEHIDDLVAYMLTLRKDGYEPPIG